MKNPNSFVSVKMKNKEKKALHQFSPRYPYRTEEACSDYSDLACGGDRSGCHRQPAEQLTFPARSDQPDYWKLKSREG
jgi:hypothetical protein